jgi:hypothetical protein
LCFTCHPEGQSVVVSLVHNDVCFTQVIASLNEREQYSRGEQRKLTAQLAEVQSDFRAARDVWRRREVELLDQVGPLLPFQPIISSFPTA